MSNVKNVKAYEHHCFESGTTNSKEFLSLARKLKRYFNDLCKENGFEMLQFNVGHFDCSSYVRHVPTGRMVYLAIRDVRLLNGEWYRKVLCRAVDKIGDINSVRQQYCPMEDLGDTMVKLINIEGKWSRNQLRALGNEIASLWGASCYGYSFDHNNQKVVFNCIEHGEEFTTSQAYSEF